MRDDIEQALQRNKEANKLFSAAVFKGAIKSIEKQLDADEQVLYLRNCNTILNNTQPLKGESPPLKDVTPGVLAVTNDRVIFCQKVIFQEKLIQFSIDEIKSFEFEKNPSVGVFRITSIAKSIDIYLSGNKHEIQLLNDTMRNATKKTSPPIPASPSNSDADEIAKFKTLLDSGAITHEEYDAKKKQLLGI